MPGVRFSELRMCETLRCSATLLATAVWFIRVFCKVTPGSSAPPM